MRDIQEHIARVRRAADGAWSATPYVASTYAKIRALELELPSGRVDAKQLGKPLRALLASEPCAHVSRLLVTRRATLATSEWLDVVGALFSANARITMVSVQGWFGPDSLSAERVLEYVPRGGVLRIAEWGAPPPTSRTRATRPEKVKNTYTYRSGGKVLEIECVPSGALPEHPRPKDAVDEYERLTFLTFLT